MGIRTAVFLTSLLLPAYAGTLAFEQSESADRYAEQYRPLARHMSELAATYSPPGSSVIPPGAAVQLRIDAAERLAAHAFYTRGSKPSARLRHLRDTLGELRGLTRTQHELLTTQSRANEEVIRLERLQQASLYRLRRATDLLLDRAARALSADNEQAAHRSVAALGLFIGLCAFLVTTRPKQDLPTTA